MSSKRQVEQKSLQQQNNNLRILLVMLALSYDLRFLFKNRSWSTCFELSTLLCAVTISPALEKTRSEETLVPGMHRYTLARRDISGYSFWCSFHQLSGLPSARDRGGASLYLDISSSAWACVVLCLTAGPAL